MILTSALPPLKPEIVVNKLSGEIVEIETLESDLTSLSTFVTDEAKRLWELHAESLPALLEPIKASSPAEIGRQTGIKPNLDPLSRSVKAKSRIARLVHHKLISTATSYFENPNPLKELPGFSSLMSLGAVDNQMASMEIDGSELTLHFKCWENEYIIHFTIPGFILARDIQKFSLPTIRNDEKLGWTFQFSIQENSVTGPVNNDLVAGIDLGRVQPFTLAIMHEGEKSIVAEYTASKRIHVLTSKRDRLNIELGFLKSKSEKYKKLGIDSAVLDTERKLTRNKRNRLINAITWQIAAEVDQKIARHQPKYINVEDLTWVNPKHGMSRWTHSQDQVAIAHKLNRSGRKMQKVSARNTSQECYKCGGAIAHHKGTRQVVCSTCSTTKDRDINASANIALRLPLRKRRQGNNSILTDVDEVMVLSEPDETALLGILGNTR